MTAAPLGGTLPGVHAEQPSVPAANLRRSRGDAAERLAADYLAIQGMRILARNVRCKGGEIDIVCLDGALLAVIEVRQRARPDFGGPFASVTPAKQRKIIRAARHLLKNFALCRGRRMRFDVIGVQGLPDGAHEISWIKDAFRAT